MELKHIKELMAVMQRTGTKRLVIKKDDVELELEREGRLTRISESDELLDDNPMKEEIATHRANMILSRESAAPLGAPNKEASEVSGNFVTSPMVGTFYTNPSPEDPPFVKVGDRVEKDTVVCIIEAMKVMNEVKAGVSGTLSEVLVETGNPVEFGTKLFRIN